MVERIDFRKGGAVLKRNLHAGKKQSGGLGGRR